MCFYADAHVVHHPSDSSHVFLLYGRGLANQGLNCHYYHRPAIDRIIFFILILICSAHSDLSSQTPLYSIKIHHITVFSLCQYVDSISCPFHSYSPPLNLFPTLLCQREDRWPHCDRPTTRPSMRTENYNPRLHRQYPGLLRLNKDLGPP